MKCVKCGKPAAVSVQNLESCDSCFQKIIEKRVRKEIRTNNLIDKDDKILILDNGSAESQLSSYLLKRIIKDLPVKITIKKLDYTHGKALSGDFNKIIVPWNADLEDEYFLSCIFQNKEIEFLGHYKIDNKTYVKLFLPVLSSEVEVFAKIKKLDFKKNTKKSITQDMMDKLEKEYPETKFSLLSSAEQFRKK
ncbi:MAG: hypothetical protein AABW92_01390 [Nanoarchaeota archaeon]